MVTMTCQSLRLFVAKAPEHRRSDLTSGLTTKWRLQQDSSANSLHCSALLPLQLKLHSGEVRAALSEGSVTAPVHGNSVCDIPLKRYFH